MLLIPIIKTWYERKKIGYPIMDCKQSCVRRNEKKNNSIISQKPRFYDHIFPIITLPVSKDVYIQVDYVFGDWNPN